MGRLQHIRHSSSTTEDIECADLADEHFLSQADRSSNMVSVLVIASRITGFLRTFAQAWAIGATVLTSCYTVADQLPNVLYELVLGGMLITAFLPVYVQVRRKAGREGASAYASNLLSVVLILMTALAIASFVFAVPIIWTQSAGASESFDSELAVWFFRWFAVEIIFYALSSIFSGVLNAERDYLVSNAAPIINNTVICTAFLLFGLLTREGILTDEQAVIILAIGNPLGVAMQVLVQIPSLKRHGIRLKLRVDLRDPYLRQTLVIGLPTLIVTLVGSVTSAVMSSCALSVTELGAAVNYYARVWYVLPYSVFVVPISITMFTELSQSFAAGDLKTFAAQISRGSSKVLFTIIPFVFYFFVFAPYLVQIIAGGGFSEEAFEFTVLYLRCLATALPFYCLSVFLQKVSSAMLSMRIFAISSVIAGVVQILVCLIFTPLFGLPVVPFSSTVFYAVVSAATLISLHSRLGRIGLASVVRSSMYALLFGVIGAALGFVASEGVVTLIGPIESTFSALVVTVIGGALAVCGTYATAYALGCSDAPFFDSLIGTLVKRSRQRV